MSKMTLLEMTQSILSSMDSDNVGSISDTEEALQVVDIIQDAYFHFVSLNDWQHLRTTSQMNSLSDSTRPTYLGIPSSITRIETLRYDSTLTSDTSKTINKITYCEPEEFIDKVLYRSTGDANVDSLTTDTGTPLFVYNDRFPMFWTSFDDKEIVLDAYNSSEEATSTGSRATAICYKTPIFTPTEDTFIPDLTEEMFPTFLAQCRRACILYLKQVDSPIDAKRELAGMNRMRLHGTTTDSGKKKARFGRK